MDLSKGKRKKGMIIKIWERCRASINRRLRRQSSTRIRNAFNIKSKSWSQVQTSPSCTKLEHDDDSNNKKRSRKNGAIAPEGCFSVYVGADKQRFVIRTECVNHPLFKVLLEEAEMEYGFNSEGPLALPCEVDLFWNVLKEMDFDDQVNHKQG